MIRTPSPDVLTEACAEARQRFAARVPEPQPEDFPCRWCSATSGEPCVMRVRGRSGPHRPRGDRWRRAHDAWQSAAVRACDDAVNVLCELAAVLSPHH